MSPPCRSCRLATPSLRRPARQTSGFEQLRPGQEEAIRAAAAGRDVLAVLPTDAGKSAIYQLAAPIIPGPTITRSLPERYVPEAIGPGSRRSGSNDGGGRYRPRRAVGAGPASAMKPALFAGFVPRLQPRGAPLTHHNRQATRQTIGMAVPVGWQPRTEAQLQAAAANALLEETHYLDIKRELAPPSSSVNRELARDLASFAIDGGMLIIGVDEQSNPPLLRPVALSGLAERVEQVALNAIDPPLVVQSRAIEASNRPGYGYLVVAVPPSATPPHMVDGRYWAREDKTKYRLSDGDVSRLHRLRQAWERDAVTMLDGLVAADPVPPERRQQAHLFLVAVPVPSRERLLLEALPDARVPQAVLELVHQQALPLAGVNADGPNGFSPHVGSARQFELRPAGWALTSYKFSPGRALPIDVDEGGLIELELDEDGTLKAFCARASARLSRSGQDVVFERLVIGVTRQFLAVARKVSEVAGHWGSWDIAVAMTGLRGKASYIADFTVGLLPSPYAGDEYKEGARASVQDLQTQPGRVTERLLGRFVRALGTRDHPSVANLLQ